MHAHMYIYGPSRTMVKPPVATVLHQVAISCFDFQGMTNFITEKYFKI